MKTALVTGASRGIGQATAVNLLGRGYKVHGTFNHSEAEARELERAYENLTFHQADFSDRTSTNHLIEELAGERFDAIVNNAGIFEMEDFSDFDFKIWDQLIEVNLSAPLIIAMSLRDQINEGGAVVKCVEPGRACGLVRIDGVLCLEGCSYKSHDEPGQQFW